MPIFTFIAVTVLGLTAGTFLAGAVAAGLGLITSLGLNYAIQALSGKPTNPTNNFSVQGTLATGGDVPRSFNVGYSPTAGSLVYANTGVGGGGHTDTPNAWLTQVIALSDLPGGTLQEVWVNGAKCTLADHGNSVGLTVLEYTEGAAEYLYVKYYDGTQTTADATCVSWYGSDPVRPYASTRVGTGIAYVVVHAFVHDSLFTGFPTFKFALSGIPLYDPSKDTTVGGSGSHRYATPSTWGGDGDNLPAVQAYNILRGISYNGAWLYGPQKMTAPRLPVSNWLAQIAKCRATITGVSGLEATYRSGGQINVNSQPVAALETILTACQGRLSEIGGFYKIHLGAPDSTSFYFTDDVILSTEEQNFTPFFPLSDSVNGITSSYPSPAQGWNATVAPPYFRTDLELLDGNRRLLANPSFDFVPYDAQVQRLMKSAVLEAQRARRHTLVLPPEYWTVEPGDVGEWTSVRNGYTSKQFRVDGLIDKANLDVTTNVTEVDPSDYSWTHSTDFTPVTVGPAVYVTPPSQIVVGWTATAVTIFDSNGISRRPAIQLGWDGTQAGIAAVQYEIRLQSSGVVITRGRTDQYSAGSLIVADSILPNTAYEARGAYVPSSPRAVTWSAWTAVTSPDARLSLLDFDAAVVAQTTTITDYLNDQINFAMQTISAISANQDARNWTDKQTIRSQLSATYLANVAFITSVQTVSVAADAALASSLSTLSATVAGNTASISTQSTAIATLNGYAAAAYSVTLDVNGFATGFALVNGGSGVSSFTITTAKFQIALSGSPGSSVPVFTTGLVGGVSKVAIRGDMIVDGSITATMISVGTLSAISANIGAVTAGTITSTNGKMSIDLTNARELISD